MKIIEVELLGEDELVEQLCLMYWEVDAEGGFEYKIATISREFGVSQSEVSRIAQKYSKGLSTEVFCEKCFARYVYRSRQHYKDSKYKTVWVCEECVEKEIRDAETEILRRLSLQFEGQLQHSFSVEELNFKQAVFLLSVIKHLAAEDFEILEPYASNQTNLLSPSADYDMQILSLLEDSNIIAVSPKSDTCGIELTEENGYRYYQSRVRWEILFKREVYPSADIFVRHLENKLISMEWRNEWLDEAKELFKEVALEETLAYLNYVMAKHQFDFTPGKKTVFVLNAVLEHFSVAQAYSFIWRAARDAAAYFMRENIPKKQAANSVVGRIERSYERAITNKWDVDPFKRNYDLSMSDLSLVLYGNILKTDDGGFYKPLPELVKRMEASFQ